MPSDERTGLTIHKFAVRAIAASKKTRGVNGYPQAQYGRERLGSFLRRQSRAIAVNAKKIQTAKTNRE
jgi:hypothetical protein